MFTQEQLQTDLRALGIRPDSTVTVHTSLKAVGPIDPAGKTTAEMLIAALRACVPEGLLVIPAHTFRNIRETPVFDIRHTLPCIGAVPTAAVGMANRAFDAHDPACIRSFHPSHSVVAFGRDAVPFTADDRYAETPMPAFGCYRKLLTRSALILLIGVGLECCTYIHMIDEYLHPEGVSAPVPVTGIDYDGMAYPRRMGRCEGPSALYPQYRPILEQAGALTLGKLGGADVIVCDARRTFDAICGARRSGFTFAR